MIYSTNDVHPRERLSYWLEVATRGYVEHEFKADDSSSFSGSVEIASLPGVGLAGFDAAPARIRRSARYTARADSGDVLLGVHHTGDMSVSQDGRDTLLSGRCMFLVDPLRPFDIELRTWCTSTVIKIPRAKLEARVGNFAGLTARPVLPTSGIGAVAIGFLELLPDQARSLDDVAGVTVAEQMLDLVSLAFTAENGRGTALSSPRAVALMRLKATIERLLIEAGLKPERIAAEAGISVRYANALLAEEGTSVERYVAERRLERCRNALEDPAQAHRSIGEIAFKWGFSDLSHFGRRFKQRYAMTPTEYRRRAERVPAGRPLAEKGGRAPLRLPLRETL